jgi:hypothetical protein
MPIFIFKRAPGRVFLMVEILSSQLSWRKVVLSRLLFGTSDAIAKKGSLHYPMGWRLTMGKP